MGYRKKEAVLAESGKNAGVRSGRGPWPEMRVKNPFSQGFPRSFVKYDKLSWISKVGFEELDCGFPKSLGLTLESCRFHKKTVFYRYFMPPPQ